MRAGAKEWTPRELDFERCKDGGRGVRPETTGTSVRKFQRSAQIYCGLSETSSQTLMASNA
jgi:hypothetical protein